ncbi:hypothetical protein EDB84DRAFT_1640501 [Lactarius hengduanensis]|nr:hypothetical protein EDB84DRAFT_1640501 [Lactarius hengduanensis]
MPFKSYRPLHDLASQDTVRGEGVGRTRDMREHPLRTPGCRSSSLFLKLSCRPVVIVVDGATCSFALLGAQSIREGRRPSKDGANDPKAGSSPVSATPLSLQTLEKATGEASGMDYGEKYNLEHDKLIGHSILATWVTQFHASVTKATRKGQGDEGGVGRSSGHVPGPVANPTYSDGIYAVHTLHRNHQTQGETNFQKRRAPTETSQNDSQNTNARNIASVMVGTVLYEISPQQERLEFLILENRNQGTRYGVTLSTAYHVGLKAGSSLSSFVKRTLISETLREETPGEHTPISNARTAKQRNSPERRNPKRASTWIPRQGNSVLRLLRSSRSPVRVYSPRPCACRRVRFTGAPPRTRRPWETRQTAASSEDRVTNYWHAQGHELALPRCHGSRLPPNTHDPNTVYDRCSLLFLFFGVRPTPVTVTTFRTSGVFTALPGSALTPFVASHPRYSHLLLAFLPSLQLALEISGSVISRESGAKKK